MIYSSANIYYILYYKSYMSDSVPCKSIVKRREDFFNIRRKDIGVERGFFAYVVHDLKE